MKELIVKILSHFSKNALATMVVGMGVLLAGYWYNDYKKGQDYIKLKLDNVIDGQVKIKGEVNNNFNSVYTGLDDLKQGQAAINVKIDILKQAQPKPVRQQVDQVDNLVERLENKRVPDSIDLQPILTNEAKLEYAVTDIQFQVDTVKKKVSFSV